MKSILILALALFSSQKAMAASDALAQQSIKIVAKDVDVVLEKTIGNVKSIFNRYKVALDSSTKILSPLQVGGTQTNPTIKVTMEKCVMFICQTVSLDAEITVRTVSGRCEKNYAMAVDLSRSSKTLTDIYDQLNVNICFNKNSTGGQADLIASAQQAANYSSGIVQREIFKLLQLQVKPIITALNETLRSNGAQ
ncbi:MAG: hypothetical protein ACK5P7_02365 [Bdellovibrio sp.]